MATHVFLPLPPQPAGSYQQLQPYGPGSPGPFQPALLVGLSSAVQATSPARAVISGAVRMFIDLALPTRCQLVLIPDPLLLDDMRQAFGNGAVCFVYEWLSTVDVMRRLQPILEKNKLRSDKRSKDERWTAFAAGVGSIKIKGGEPLGLTANAELSLGIVYLSMFGVDLDAAPAHLRALIDPLKKRRRSDPAAFFKNTFTGQNSGLVSDPSDSTHSLWPVLTYRMLIELRDEYDQPLDGVSVTIIHVETGNTFPLTFRGADWATFDWSVLSGVPAGTFKLVWAQHIFTELPSGSSDATIPQRFLVEPFHWALQTIHMDHNDAADMWFGPNPGPDERLNRYTAKNRVLPLVDGIAALKSIVGAMRSVKTSDHWFYITAWWLSNDFDLDPRDPKPTSFKALVEGMALQGAKVYGLAWSQVAPLEGWRRNREAVSHINTLAYKPSPTVNQRVGFGVIDNNLPPRGSHHQKSMVINGSLGAIAYLGGVDVNPNRLDDGSHAVKGPYHDLHCFVDGPAVADISANFQQRWNTCTDRIEAGFPSLDNTAPYEPNPGTHYVQVTRTFARKGNAYPTFAPRGEYGTLHAIIRAINRAKRFIYMEEQYAYPYPGDLPYDPSQEDTGLTLALRNALPRIEFLLILIPNHAGVPQDRKRRETFIGALKAIAPNKVFVFYLKRPKKKGKGDHEADIDAEMQSENALHNNDTVDATSANPSGGLLHPDEIYVHTKGWIIDDVYAKIGSANVGRRSLTLDSELDLHLIDGALTNGSRRFALNLRRELWKEHLGRDIPEDPAAGLELWKNPGPDPRILPYEEHKGVLPGTDANWNFTMDPFGDVPGGDAKP